MAEKRAFRRFKLSKKQPNFAPKFRKICCFSGRGWRVELWNNGASGLELPVVAADHHQDG